MAIEFKTVTDAEFPAWSDAVSVGFFAFEQRGNHSVRRAL